MWFLTNMFLPGLPKEKASQLLFLQDSKTRATARATGDSAKRKPRGRVWGREALLCCNSAFWNFWVCFQKSSLVGWSVFEPWPLMCSVIHIWWTRPNAGSWFCPEWTSNLRSTDNSEHPQGCCLILPMYPCLAWMWPSYLSCTDTMFLFCGLQVLSALMAYSDTQVILVIHSSYGLQCCHGHWLTKCWVIASTGNIGLGSCEPVLTRILLTN